MAADRRIPDRITEQDSLKVGQWKIMNELNLQNSEFVHLKADVDTKHGQNRTSIHQLRDQVQDMVDLITNIRISNAKSNAKWSALSGAITALLIEGLKLLFKH